MKTIRFGYTPDTDDAFHYFALETGAVAAPPDARFEFRRAHIETLNELALAGELEVTAISSILHPLIADRYVVLAAGASVGRNYGPVLGMKKGRGLSSDLSGKTVAVPGRFTTGYFLLNYFYRGFTPVFMPFDEIAGAVESGEADAGVLIHEELLNYKLRGLEQLSCLGNRWFMETGLPLPVGLTVAKRDLGEAWLHRIKGLLEQSMRYALNHSREASDFAFQFATGRGEVSAEFISKFANEDTERMPDDVRKGLEELYRRAYQRGLIDREPALEIVG